MNLVIQKTKECSDQLELLQTSPEEYDRTKNLLTSKSEQLSAICTNTTLTKYTIHLNDPQRQQKQENAMQRTTGYDILPPVIFKMAMARLFVVYI